VPEVHDRLVELQKMRKKRKTTKTNKRGPSEVDQEYIDESEMSREEQLVVLECIEVQ